MSILGELKRRKIFQVIAVYAVVAWLVVQVITSIEGPLNLPDWTDTLVIVLLGLGFPVMLVISWAFNVTPDGLVRDEGSDAGTSGSGRTIEFVLIGLVGIAVVWLIYRTEFDTLQTDVTAETSPVEEAAPDVLPNSIAVLPFANLSPDPDNAFFAAGIHDTILNELAKIDELDVISRTTMMRYAETTKSMPEIAEELGAGRVLEGTVQFAAGQVRVTAQLIDPINDSHIWSSIYDRDFEDIFEIQADIATRIAAAMDAELTPQESADIRSTMTDSPVAQARYWQAMELIDWDFSPGDSTAEVHRLLDEAIEADSDFALAYAAKANVYAYNRHEIDLAFDYAERAIEIDPNLGSAYGALASIANRQMRDDDALALFEKALELNPNDIDILDNYSRQIIWLKSPEFQLELAARVLEIDPGRLRYLSVIQWNADRREDALATIRKAATQEPENHQTQLRAALIEFLMGNQSNSDQFLRAAIELQAPNDWSMNTLGQEVGRYGIIGAHAEAEKLFEIFSNRAATEPSGTVDPGLWLRACLGIGDLECIRDSFQRTIEQTRQGYRSISGWAVASNYYGLPLLDEPEFVELRKQLGFDFYGL